MAEGKSQSDRPADQTPPTLDYRNFKHVEDPVSESDGSLGRAVVILIALPMGLIIGIVTAVTVAAGVSGLEFKPKFAWIPLFLLLMLECSIINRIGKRPERWYIFFVRGMLAPMIFVHFCGVILAFFGGISAHLK